MKYTKGIKVKLREDSKWVDFQSNEKDSSNPLNMQGEIISTDSDDRLPYQVKWANSKTNSYNEDDLYFEDNYEIY